MTAAENNKTPWSGKQIDDTVAPNEAEWKAAKDMLETLRRGFEAQALADPSLRYPRVMSVISLELLHEVLGLPPEMWK